MSRYTGPSWKVSRRLGISLSGTGKELARRPYAPGQHGQNNRRKLSEYGLQLREKQKLRMTYGLSERQSAEPRRAQTGQRCLPSWISYDTSSSSPIGKPWSHHG